MRLSRKHVQSLHEILCSQVRVPPKHLHRFVTAYGCSFLIAQPHFDKAADGLVSEVMES